MCIILAIWVWLTCNKWLNNSLETVKWAACLTVKGERISTVHVHVVTNKDTVILTNHCNCSCIFFKHRVPIAIGSCTMILSGVTGVTRSVYSGECKTWPREQHGWIVILCPLQWRFRVSSSIAKESHIFPFNNLCRFWIYSNLSWNYREKKIRERYFKLVIYML